MNSPQARIWLSDRIVDSADALVHVSERAFMSGDGVFETLKVVDGQPFAVTRHLARLAKSARIVGIDLPVSWDFEAALRETIDANSVRTGGSARARITISAGPAGKGISRGDAGLTIVITCDPQPAHPDSLALVSVPWRHNERGATVGAKTTSYSENLVILERARAVGADEAVIADTSDRLAEATTANVVVEHEGRLITPSLTTGCLPGVTRSLLLEWQILDEFDVAYTRLAKTSEVLLSSSTRSLIPARTMDGRELAAPGPLGAAAMTAFDARAGEDLNP